jgi:hypothetical protein
MSSNELNYKKMKNFDQIGYRILFIQKMLKDNKLTPLIDIEVEDEKSESTDIRDKLSKKVYDFTEIMNSIDSKLLYVKSGSTGHTFKGYTMKDTEPGFSFGIKVVAFPKKEKYGNLHDARRPENAELMMLKILSYFVMYNHTPHIILPIATFNTSIKPFVSLPKFNIINNKRYDEFVERYKKHEYYDQVSVLLSEWANNGDLLDYLRKHYKTMKCLQWKIIIFQILSVLAVIHNKYPDFRHNDMKANNILIHKIECHRNNKFKYKINGQKYVIPNIGFQIKLWDFDFACIPSLVPNTKVEAKWTDKINIKPVKNQYYDIHYFFNTLTKKGFLPDLLTSDEISKELQEFIMRVVPEKYSTGDNITEKGRLLLDVEYVTADHLLKNDPFFEAFRVSERV